jgi:uncharacterized protein YbaP (TraB family)
MIDLNAKPADPLRMYRRALSAIDPDARVSWLAGTMRVTQAQARDFLTAAEVAVYSASTLAVERPKPKPPVSQRRARSSAPTRYGKEKPSEKALEAVRLASQGVSREQIADRLGFANADSVGSALSRTRAWLRVNGEAA